METELMRITEIARHDKTVKFTSLAHLLNQKTLMQCHYELPRGKATGIHRITKEDYEVNLKENIANLVEAMKTKRYRPVPVRRTYIPKDNKATRPLGIPEYEDKIVQKGVTKILNAIYEEDFLDCSFGFRPIRNCHDALKTLNVYLESRPTNYVVDVDIKGFFDNVDHKWMMKFLEHRISDPNFLRIIGRFLKGGYMEDGKRYKTESGTPQGGVISPVLANIYLHYVLDLWFEKRIKKWCKGQAYLVRYADDFVCCFQHEQEALSFYEALIMRLAEFGLEIAQDKTKVIPFGRYAQKNHEHNGKPKPGTFDFLGFTHYCGKSKKGKFRVKRKTSRKKMTKKIKECEEWLRNNRNRKMTEIIERLRRSLMGYYNYYCITDNLISVRTFVRIIIQKLFKWMNRRSQRKSFTWEKFYKFLNRYPLPEPVNKVNIYDLRFHVQPIL